jgi:hypothetical protein
MGFWMHKGAKLLTVMNSSCKTFLLAKFRSGAIRVLDSTGNVERTIAFNEADRKL